jgi:cytochrome c-type biogenesis protein CcmE
MKPRFRRLIVILIFGGFMTVAVAVVLYKLNNAMTYFYTPHDVLILPEKPTKPFRLGGMVQKGSYHPLPNGGVTFTVGDMTDTTMTVYYQGLVPDLFREGQGVIAEGTLTDTGIFQASQVLAKHDEKYMPPVLEKSLNQQTQQQENRP